MGPSHVHACYPASGECTTPSLRKPGLSLTLSQLRNRIRWHGTMDVWFGGRGLTGLALSPFFIFLNRTGANPPGLPTPLIRPVRTTIWPRPPHNPAIHARSHWPGSKAVFFVFWLIYPCSTGKSGISTILVFSCLRFPWLACVAMNGYGSPWNLVL